MRYVNVAEKMFALQVYDMIDALFDQGQLADEITPVINRTFGVLLSVDFVRSYLFHRHGEGEEETIRSRIQSHPGDLSEKYRARRDAMLRRTAKAREAAQETARKAREWLQRDCLVKQDETKESDKKDLCEKWTETVL